MNTNTNLKILLKTGVILAITAAGVVLLNKQNAGQVSVVVPQVKQINDILLENAYAASEAEKNLSKENILADAGNRIADEFSIPAGLEPRVGFWFDIYSKYDSYKKVIHHVSYPWIVFKVVDVTDIIYSNKPRLRWQRNIKADKYVAQEVHRIEKAINDLAKGKTVNNKNEYHVMVERALQNLPGSLKKNAKTAVNNIRVQTGQKDFFAKGLETSPIYLPEMEEIFRKQKLPIELTRIPFVESSFNTRAVSKVGASGIWQFMTYTAKSFLMISDHIDERNSPFKASAAAAKLLKQNYIILKKSWPLAITAWNHGPTGLRKAMKAANASNLSDIIKRYQSKTFDFASSNFYCEFLAALHVERYHEHLFEELKYEKGLELHIVKLGKKISARELLRKSGLNKEIFVAYNLDLKRAIEANISLPSGFSLIVDSSTRSFLKNLITKDSITNKGIKISQSGLSMNTRD